MININFEIVSVLKEIKKILDKNNKKQEHAKEELKQDQIEKSNIQYMLEQNRKEEKKWSKMWE